MSGCQDGTARHPHTQSPQTPVALSPLPAPQPEHQSGVSSPLHGADGAPRIGKVPSRVLGLVVWQGSAPSPCAAPGPGLPNWCRAARAESPLRASQGSICPCRHCHGTELCGARSRFQSRLFARFSSFSTSPFPPEPPRSRDPGALRPHGEGGDVGGGHGAELGVPPTSGSTNAAVGPGAAPAAPQRPHIWQGAGWHKEKGRGEGQGRINISLALQKHQREIMV